MQAARDGVHPNEEGHAKKRRRSSRAAAQIIDVCEGLSSKKSPTLQGGGHRDGERPKEKRKREDYSVPAPRKGLFESASLERRDFIRRNRSILGMSFYFILGISRRMRNC